LIVFSSFPCNNLVVCIVDVFIISYYCVGGWNWYRLDINMSLLWKKMELLWVVTRSAWKYIKIGLKRVVFFPGKGGYPKWRGNYVVGFWFSGFCPLTTKQRYLPLAVPHALGSSGHTPKMRSC
jgi:hypothetical protein